ncbi:hypothetical protein [Dactylosporangium sp. NPDC048998]|uniref:hypothetical protein n=1 Tax=Dactylosporangium sp. NPDC048998 TaxID=3363976 RepID=UPI00371B117B
MTKGLRPRPAASLDLGLHLGRLLRRPLARWLKMAPAEIEDDLRRTPTTWDEMALSHWLRLFAWGGAAGACFVLGIASATVEQLVTGHSGQPSAALQVLFGTALVTALLHYVAALLVGRAARRGERATPTRRTSGHGRAASSGRRPAKRGAAVGRGNTAPDGPAGLARVLLWPGNRYFLVAAAFFAVAVVSVSG